MILNIEIWQHPDTVKIEEVNEVIKLPFDFEKNDERKPYKGKFAPEFRSEYILFFNDKNHILEGKLYLMEQLQKEYATANIKPIDKLGIMNEFREVAETYNLLVGFNCMETEITKLNIPLTNNSGKIVLNFG